MLNEDDLDLYVSSRGIKKVEVLAVFYGIS
jgi:hypothetical protein